MKDPFAPALPEKTTLHFAMNPICDFHRKHLELAAWILALLGFAPAVQAQQNVYSRSDAGTNLWENNSNLPWYYQTSNNNQSRPDLPFQTRNDVFFGHNNNLVQDVNTTTWFQLRSLTMQASATSARTFNSSGGSGISLSSAFTNEAGSGAHTFNTQMGIDGSTVTFTNSGGTVSFTNNVFVNANTLALSGASAFNFSGVLSGTGGKVTKNGTGTVTFSGSSANTYDGLTTVTAGILALNKTAGVNAIGGNVTLGDGTGGDIIRLDASNQIADSSVITMVGTTAGNRGWFQLNGQNEIIGGLASSTASAGLVDNGSTGSNSILTLQVTGSQDFSGLIRNSSGAAGTLALVKTGTGTQILSGTNTYTGGTSINAGTLQAASASAIGSSGNISFGGGTLQYTAASQNSELANRFKNSSSAIRLDTNGAAVPFGGVIDSSNTGGLIRSGTGTLQFYGSSANTYSGTTTSTGGNLFLNKTAGVTAVPGDVILGDGAGDDLLTLGQSEQIADSAVVTLVGSVSGNQGRFRLNGSNETIGGLTSASNGAGMVENGNATLNSTLTLNVTGSQDYSGVIRNGSTGTLGLVKSGSGTQTLSGAHSYTGTTSITDGKLVVNGNISTSSLTSVAVGATLGGSGTVGKTIINGTLAVGNSPGQMNFTDTLGLKGITVMEIDGMSGAGVTGGHDFVNLTGVGAAGVLTYGGTLVLDIGTIFTTGAYSWNLFDMASETGTFATISLADQYSGNLLDGDSNGIWDLTSGTNTWQFNEYNGNLSLTVVPEPNAAVLVGGLGIIALLRRRRHA